MPKKKHTEDILDNPNMTTAELIQRTQEVEDEKERKKQERLEKKRAKERKKKQEIIEKLVGPILLIVTIFISMLVMLVSK